MFPKRLLALTLFAALAVMPARVLRAQWVSMDGPNGVNVGLMISSGDSILITAGQNLYQSFNGGLTWSQDTTKLFIQYPFPDFYVEPLSFARRDSVIFVGTNAGLYSSTDFGSTWKLDSGLRGGAPIVLLGPHFFFGSTEGLGHYDQDGNQWFTAPFPIDYGAIYAVATMGSNVFVSENDDVETTGYDGIYRSRDSGVTWDSLPVLDESPSTMLVFGTDLLVGEYGGILLSTDSGTTWSLTSHNFDSESIEGLFSCGPYIFATLPDGRIMRSADTGSSWIFSDSGITSQFVGGLIQSGNRIIAGTGVGIFISTDSGESWTASNRGFPPQAINSLGIGDSELFASNVTSGIFESSTYDTNWNPRARGINADYFESLGINGPGLFAILNSSIWVSTDGGTTWSERQGNDNISFAGECFSDNSIMFVGSEQGGAFRSTDNGVTWNRAFGLNKNNFYSFTDIGSLFFAAAENGVATSTDDGYSWQLIDSDFVGSSVTSVASIGSTLFASATYPFGGLFRSLDSGLQWLRLDSTIFPTEVSALFVSQNHIFASESDDLFMSSDNGVSWNSTGLHLSTQSMATDGYTLFAGTDSGVWRRPLSDFGISSVPQTPSSASTEIQIYPNPFSQSTQITFTSQTAGYAEVSIVNMLGVEVARLFSGELGAGEHNFSWSNPTGLPDGTYECLVRMNGQVDDRSSTLESLPMVLMH